MARVILTMFILIGSTPVLSQELCGPNDQKVCLQNSLALRLRTSTPLKIDTYVTLTIPGVAVDAQLRTSGFPTVPFRFDITGSVTDSANGSWSAPIAIGPDSENAWALGFRLDASPTAEDIQIQLNQLQICQLVSEGPGPVDLKVQLWVPAAKNKDIPFISKSKKAGAFSRCEAFTGNLPLINVDSLFLVNPHDSSVSLTVGSESQLLQPAAQIRLSPNQFFRPLALKSSMPLATVLLTADRDIDTVGLTTRDHQEWLIPHIPGDQQTWFHDWIMASDQSVNLNWVQADDVGSQAVGSGLSYWTPPAQQGKASWVKIYGNRPLNGFYRIRRTGHAAGGAFIAGQRLLDFNQPGSSVLNLVHVAKDTAQFWTGYSLANPQNQSVMVTMEGIGDNGTIKATESFVIAAFANEVGIVGSQRFAGRNDIDWIRIRADRPIAGLELIGPRGSTHLAGFNLTNQTADQLNFPVVNPAEDNWSGIAIVSLAESRENASITYFAADGTVVESVPFSINSQEKRLFLAPNGAAHARVNGKSLTGFCLIGSQYDGTLGGYLAQ